MIRRHGRRQREQRSAGHHPRHGGYRSFRTAERAVQWAAAFADAYSAELHVVQVVIPLHPADTEHGTAEVTRARAAADELQLYATSLAGERGRAHVVIDDDPALAIVHATEEHDIDVLVVGNAGMAGRKEFLLGNVPNRISHNARCTVIIVNTTGDGSVATVARPSTTIRSSAVETPTEPHLISRGTKIATVFAKHGLKELFGRPDQEGAVGRRRQAKRLRSALEELGPTFAKLGQILSTRPDLMPPEFIEELATLQDNVPPLTEEQVVRVMEQELGVPWEDVFETIEPHPARRRDDRPGAPSDARRPHEGRRQGPAPRREGADRTGPRAARGVRREGGGSPGSQAGGGHAGGVRAPVRVAAPRARLPPRGREHRTDGRRDRATSRDCACRWCTRNTRRPACS